MLSDLWGREIPDIVDSATSLAARAIAGDHEGVRAQIAWRPTRYLRRRSDLADAVLTERTIQGMSRRMLAAEASVDSREIGRIEASLPASLDAVRRVLRALDIAPTALPTPDADR